VLGKHGQDDYWVELRSSQADESVEQAPLRGPAHFDFTALRLAALNPEAYGRLLKETLFDSEALRSFFQQCQAGAGASGHDLRLRIVIDRSAVELQDLRWETLRDLGDQSFLACNANQPFSRFLYSSDWAQISLRSKGELRALVVVANPLELAGGLELGGQKLAEVDVAGEIARALAALSNIQVDILARADEPLEPPQNIEMRLAEGEDIYWAITHLQGDQEAYQQTSTVQSHELPTFANLKSRLAQGDGLHAYDILYLACHGALLPSDPDEPQSPFQAYIFLEKANSAYDLVKGTDLANYIHDLPADSRPRLVLLASCQSAGSGLVPGGQSSADQGALSALGPCLVEAGIPAVVGMQANVQMDTVKRFTPAFFTELFKHGQVDKAVAVARSQIAGQPDWWAPVLYLRLREGRLWYESSFAVSLSAVNLRDLWAALKNNIRNDRCVPVLGFGLLEFLAGSSQEIARRLAERSQFPLEQRNIESLPQVTQYMAVRQRELFPRDELKSVIQETAVGGNRSFLPVDAGDLSLVDLISAIGKARRAQDVKDAHQVLASLPFSMYITANPDCLLEDALVERGRTPIVRQFYWNRALITPQVITQSDGDRRELKPTRDNPLVYHLFGSLEQERSIVLTEDDYFEYMMQINNPSAPVPIPDLVLRAWREKALLFLGFRLSDWSFRVLYRSLMTAERQSGRPLVKSVEVQLQPGDENLRPEMAADYLKKYFTDDKFDIYWGSAADFLGELWEAWQRQGAYP